MIHRYNRNIKGGEGYDAKMAYLVEIIARASVGDSIQKGVREKSGGLLPTHELHKNLNRARRMRP